MEKNQKRQLGTLEGKMSVKFAKDFAMNDEELINLGSNKKRFYID